MTTPLGYAVRATLAAAIVSTLAGCGEEPAARTGTAAGATPTSATSTPTTSTPATSTPATSTPATSAPAIATPATATPAQPGRGARGTVTPTGDTPALPLPTLTRPSAPPSGPSDQVKPRTVRGRVVARPGLGCTELVAATATWVLTGPDARGLPDGAEVEVDGLPAPQLRSPCDGTVLRARAVRPR